MKILQLLAGLSTLTCVIVRPLRWLALIMVLLTFAIVILRYALNSGGILLQESVMYLHGTLFMLAIALGVGDNTHVRVDILRPRFGPHGRDWIELAGLYLFLFPICIRILTTGDQGLTRAWMIFEGSRESDGLPLMFLFKTLVPVFAVLMLSQGLAEALKAALRLTGLRPDIEHTQSGGDTYGA